MHDLHQAKLSQAAAQMQAIKGGLGQDYNLANASVSPVPAPPLSDRIEGALAELHSLAHEESSTQYNIIARLFGHYPVNGGIAGQAEKSLSEPSFEDRIIDRLQSLRSTLAEVLDQAHRLSSRI
jgi:hypothetical protein